MSRTTTKRTQRPPRSAVVCALIAAGLSVAGHVLGKAVRDTLYLTTFPVEQLPWFFIATGVLSGVFVSVYTQASVRFSPQKVLPALSVISAVMMPLLWLAVRGGNRWSIAAAYFATSLSGTFIVSGFWAVLGELFDPRAARQLFGLVGVATTVGGLVGGFGAHVALRVMEADALLLQLAAIDLLMAIAVIELVRFARPAGATTSPADEPRSVSRESAPPETQRKGLRGAFADLASSPYLRDIAWTLAAVTIAGTLADYVLKDVAVRKLSSRREIAEFFSLFHGAVGAVTLGVQILLARPLLAKRGIGTALFALPIWLVASAGVLLAAPAALLPAATALRGGENAVRNSFHRAGYELLLVPLPADVKRRIKPFFDALLERLADGAGAVLVLVLVTVLGFHAERLGWLIVGLAAVSLWFTMRVRRGYVTTLSSNLVARAVALADVARAADDDATARAALKSTLLDARSGDRLRRTLSKSQVGLSIMKSLHLELPKQLESLRKTNKTLGVVGVAPPPAKATLAVLPPDPVVDIVRDLCDASPAIARAAIGRWDRKDKRAVPFLVRLLAREELYKDVVAALSRAGDRIAGSLVDHLEDPDEAFAVRRRLPRVLGACRSDVALAALVRSLSDRRFEVRYHSALALERIQTGEGGKRPPPEPLWTAIREEVKKSRSMWEAQRLLDDPEEAPSTNAPGLSHVVERRGAHSLQHVFRLLGLVLEQQPAELSYRAVRSDDPHFRAVGLEYLENVLPLDIRKALWPLIGDDEEAPPLSRTGRSMQEVMKELAASGMAIAPPAAPSDPGTAGGASGQ